jgi:hypothetical protein
MDRPTIYVERSGGQWEACFYGCEGKRIFRDMEKADAIRRAVRATGHDRSELRICDI